VKKGNSSSDDDSDEEMESDHWSAGDAGVDYGDAVLLSDDSSLWGSNMSHDLYDSDNPDCPLNAYHIESKPRLIILEDYNNQGSPVTLLVDCLEVPDEETQRKGKAKNAKLKLNDKHDPNTIEIIDHKSYQGF
jgi:hypothetical protein